MTLNQTIANPVKKFETQSLNLPYMDIWTLTHELWPLTHQGRGDLNGTYLWLKTE